MHGKHGFRWPSPLSLAIACLWLAVLSSHRYRLSLGGVHAWQQDTWWRNQTSGTHFSLDDTVFSGNYIPTHAHPESCRHRSEEDCRIIDQQLASAGKQMKEFFSKLRRQREEYDRHNGRNLVINRSPAGTIKCLVILLEFSNHRSQAKASRADFEKLFNGAGTDADVIPTGSMKTYLNKNSYGLYNFEAYVLDWISISQSESTCAGPSCQRGVNQNFVDCFLPGLLRADQDFQQGRIDWADFDVNFDGYLDSVIVMHTGYPAERTGSCSGIRSHAAFDPGNSWRSATSNYRLGYYATASAYRGLANERQARFNIIAHEHLHDFGLVDTYDLTGAAAGTGGWDLMGNPWGPCVQNAINPGSLSAWHKIQLGWMEPEEITCDGRYSIRAFTDHPEVFKIGDGKFGYPADEYFLIENRQPKDWDINTCNSPSNRGTAGANGGILIYHIDDSISGGNRGSGYPGNNWPRSHYRVAIVQPDGRYDLERTLEAFEGGRGNEGDLFVAGRELSPETNVEPNSASYQSGSYRRTGLRLYDFSAPGDTMEFSVSGLGSCSTTPAPTPAPTPADTPEPTPLPTPEPTPESTPEPTPLPTPPPTPVPTPLPTTLAPTEPGQTLPPTSPPTSMPTGGPTSSPTGLPTSQPSAPTTTPPTSDPTGGPTSPPTGNPTSVPTFQPTTAEPTFEPTPPPIYDPSLCPLIVTPDLCEPLLATLDGPVEGCSCYTFCDGSYLTCSPYETSVPIECPGSIVSGCVFPTPAPSAMPSFAPSDSPTDAPTDSPTSAPTSQPTGAPTSAPTGNPTSSPTEAPTRRPTPEPTPEPTPDPTPFPTTIAPASQPSPTSSGQCFLRSNLNECPPLLASTTPRPGCSCYNFCGTTELPCTDYGEFNFITCGSNAVLGCTYPEPTQAPTFAPSPSPVNQECSVSVSVDQCAPLVENAGPRPDCACRNFCNGGEIECCEPGEPCILSCEGSFVAGCKDNVAPTPAPTDPRCAVSVNTDQCSQIEQTPVSNCQCYNYCDGEFLSCSGFNEFAPISCSGNLVAGCINLEQPPRGECQVKVARDQCGPLIANQDPIPGCDCYDYCNGEFVGCCAYGEFCGVSCPAGNFVAGCETTTAPAPTLAPFFFWPPGLF